MPFLHFKVFHKFKTSISKTVHFLCLFTVFEVNIIHTLARVINNTAILRTLVRVTDCIDLFLKFLFSYSWIFKTLKAYTWITVYLRGRNILSVWLPFLLVVTVIENTAIRRILVLSECFNLFLTFSLLGVENTDRFISISCRTVTVIFRSTF